MLPGRDDQLINLKTPLLLPSSPEQSIGGRFIFKGTVRIKRRRAACGMKTNQQSIELVLA
jgi:hypothetical protein